MSLKIAYGSISWSLPLKLEYITPGKRPCFPFQRISLSTCFRQKHTHTPTHTTFTTFKINSRKVEVQGGKAAKTVCHRTKGGYARPGFPRDCPSLWISWCLVPWAAGIGLYADPPPRYVEAAPACLCVRKRLHCGHRTSGRRETILRLRRQCLVVFETHSSRN